MSEPIRDRVRRILVIDDNHAIHEDFRKIFDAGLGNEVALSEAETALFGDVAPSTAVPEYQIDSAFQGQEGLDLICRARAEGRPYAMMFTDMRMPPGWDGVETTTRIWEQDPDVQAVICTAYSDYSWGETLTKLGHSDRLVILKKPFDNIEALQLANALTEKWRLAQQAKCRLSDLERLVAERTSELRSAHTDTERLLATIPSILIVVDERGRVARWNTTAEAVFSLPAAAVVGRPFRGLDIRWAEKTLPDQILDRERSGRHAILRNVGFTHPDGRPGYLNLLLTPILGSHDGIPAGVLVLGEDQTEHRYLEAQLAQAQKLEAIGFLAAGIAHEINTPIQYIGDNTRYLRDAFAELASVVHVVNVLLIAARSGQDLAGPIAQLASTVDRTDTGYLLEEVPRAIEQSIEGVSTVARIVRSMKEFSHPGGDERTWVDLNHVLENVITVTRNEWKHIAEVKMNCQPQVPVVSCFPGELNQVFLNLIINAAHAIQASKTHAAGATGTITVATCHTPEYVEVRIADTGCGIPEEIRSRIFDPFFTTKEVGKGTGLGLSLAHTVIKKHCGTIAFETQVDKGTVFTIRLPLSPAVSVAS